MKDIPILFEGEIVSVTYIHHQSGMDVMFILFYKDKYSVCIQRKLSLHGEWKSYIIYRHKFIGKAIALANSYIECREHHISPNFIALGYNTIHIPRDIDFASGI